MKEKENFEFFYGGMDESLGVENKVCCFQGFFVGIEKFELYLVGEKEFNFGGLEQLVEFVFESENLFGFWDSEFDLLIEGEIIGSKERLGVLLIFDGYWRGDREECDIS